LQAAGNEDVFPANSRFSRPQKLATPTFQVPPWYTATPLWLASAGWPPTSIEYVTVACVGDVTTTFVTFAVAEAARPEPACALMIEAKVGPSCSKLIRVAVGVFALKKAVQLAVIFWAAAPPVAEEAEADEAGAELLAVELELLAVELPLPPPLLLQAARPAPSAQARAIWESDLPTFIQTLLRS
jgi:hypothetical protein